MELDPSPLALEDAREILGAATERDLLFGALLRAIRTRASHAALLAVRGGSARGRFALAGKEVDESISRVELAVDAVPALRAVVSSAQPAVVPLATGDPEIDERLTRLLGVVPPTALLLPISLRGRVVALAIGHRGEREIHLEDVVDIINLRDAVTEAILRSILVAKGDSRPVKRPPTETFETRATTLEQSEDWEALARELRAEISQSSAEDAVPLFERLGELLRDRLDRPEEAAVAFGHARDLAPDNLDVLDALAELHRRLERWVDLIDVLLEVAQHREGEGRVALLEEVAQIYSDTLDDRESAYMVLQTALKDDPLSDRIAERLEELAASTGNWEELVADDAERAVALEETDPVAACEQWVKVGRLYVDKLGNIDQGIASTRRALAIDGDHLEALQLLSELQERAEAWFDLVETLGRRADLEPGLDERVELRLAVGDVFENRLDQPAAATASFRAALDEDPTCILALVSLERLLRRAEQWPELVEVLGRLLELRDDTAERVRLKLEIAEVLADQLDDTQAAIDAYEEIRELDPDNADALAGLEKLYERANESERYMDVLEAQLDTDPDDDRRARLYGRLASVWENDFERPERAAAVLEKLTELEPERREHYDKLAAIYRAAGDRESLVATYEAALGELEEPESRAEILVALAEVHERAGDGERAIDRLREALGLDVDRDAILDRLARLHESRGEHQRAVDALMLRIDGGEPTADLYFEVGRITADELGDAERGEFFLRRALELDGEHQPAIELLAEVLDQRGKWTGAAEMFARAAAGAGDPADQVRLHARAGKLYFDRLDDAGRAEVELAAALALDPRCAEAAAPLAEIHYRAESWSALAPLLEVVIAASESWPARERAELWYRAGRCAAAGGDHARAIEHYARAHRLDPEHPRAMLAQADLCYDLDRWSRAGELYRELLARGADDPDVARIYLRMASIHQRGGEPERALDMIARCLSIDPDNPEAHDAAIEIRSGLGDYAGVIESLRAKLEGASGDDRADLYQHIGDIYRDKLDSRQKAIASYYDALEIRPDDHQVMQKLLDIYSDAKQWARAVEIIERFLEVEADPLRRASYFLAAAAITREELLDRDRALELSESALDSLFADPERLDDATFKRGLETFREIDEALTEAEAWKRQEQAYRRMIKRVGDRDKSVAARLWHALGEIYRSRLKHFVSALEAFNIAQKLDPDNSIRVSILAELSMLADGEKTASIERLTEVIAAKPTAYDAYRTLFQMYVDTNAHDRAWCVAGTLVALDQADEGARAYYQKYRPRRLLTTRETMTSALWKRVRHPTEDSYVSAIFSAINEGVALASAKPPKAYGLKKKEQAGADDAVSSTVVLIADLVERLDVRLPVIYEQPEQEGHLMLANCVNRNKLAPAMVVRRQMQDCSRREAAFLAAKLLAYLRPERFLKIALPTNTERRTALHAAISLATPELPVPAEVSELVAAFVPQIREHLSPAMFEQLKIVVDTLMAEGPTIDTKRWSHGADATAHRVGLLFCGEATTAVKLVSREQQLVGGPTTEEKINDLLAFSVSEDFFATREQLKLTVV